MLVKAAKGKSSKRRGRKVREKTHLLTCHPGSGMEGRVRLIG